MAAQDRMPDARCSAISRRLFVKLLNKSTFSFHHKPPASSCLDANAQKVIAAGMERSVV
jgi:hypothetical protein